MDQLFHILMNKFSHQVHLSKAITGLADPLVKDTAILQQQSWNEVSGSSHRALSLHLTRHFNKYLCNNKKV